MFLNEEQHLLAPKCIKYERQKKGGGKSWGFRNIFFWKRDELIVFCVLFGKNEQDNLTADEKKALKIWSDEYNQLTEDEIRVLVKNNKFKEINYGR